MSSELLLLPEESNIRVLTQSSTKKMENTLTFFCQEREPEHQVHCKLQKIMFDVEILAFNTQENEDGY